MQTDQCPAMSLPRRHRLDIQNAGDLAVSSLLEVAHDQDLAVGACEPSEDLVYASREFAASQLLARCRPAREELFGEKQRRSVRQGNFPPDGPLGGAGMPPPRHREPLISRFAQPDMKGHRSALEKFGQSTGRVELGVLNDVRRVEPATQLRVHSQFDKM